MFLPKTFSEIENEILSKALNHKNMNTTESDSLKKNQFTMRHLLSECVYGKHTDGEQPPSNRFIP
jgi:hypothetical protein